MKAIGLDIGTTTICGIVIDIETGVPQSVKTLPNDAALAPSASWERIQDPVRILSLCTGMIEAWITEYPDIRSIGLTGQMHGIVYHDAKGCAVSPLYTWQDERGNVRMADGTTSVEQMSFMLRRHMATGFGLTTHRYNALNGLVPKTAAGFCAIHDLVGMALTGRTTPLVHISDAASFGGFNLEMASFERSILDAAEFGTAMLPEVAHSLVRIGETRHGIPVCAGIGDNQASYIGSMADDNAVLINIGTGGQISARTQATAIENGLEIRPLDGEARICVGSTLCAGDAYGLLRNFFRELLRHAGASEADLFPLLDEMAAQVHPASDPLRVDTRFRGTRSDPSIRGSMTNLTTSNFTPGHMALGFLTGICGELRELYRAMPKTVFSAASEGARLVGSGNGIRKSPLMRRILQEQFGMTLLIPVVQEEAAYGAALTSLVSGGFCESLDQARKKIQYLAQDSN